MNKLSPTANKSNQVPFHAQGYFQASKVSFIIQQSIFQVIFPAVLLWFYELLTAARERGTDPGVLTNALQQNYIEPLLCARWIRDIFGHKSVSVLPQINNNTNSRKEIHI